MVGKNFYKMKKNIRDVFKQFRMAIMRLQRAAVML